MAFSCIIVVMLTTGKTHFTLNFKLQKTWLTTIGKYPVKIKTDTSKYIVYTNHNSHNRYWYFSHITNVN